MITGLQMSRINTKSSFLGDSNKSIETEESTCVGRSKIQKQNSKKNVYVDDINTLAAFFEQCIDESYEPYFIQDPIVELGETNNKLESLNSLCIDSLNANQFNEHSKRFCAQKKVNRKSFLEFRKYQS